MADVGLLALVLGVAFGSGVSAGREIEQGLRSEAV
jgi:hypothetical protein